MNDNSDNDEILTEQEKAEFMVGMILLLLAFIVVGFVLVETHSLLPF